MLGPGFPEPLSDLIASLLAAAPSKRPDAAGPVRDALRRLALIHTAPGDAAGSTALGPAFSAVMLPASSLPGGALPTAMPLRTRAVTLWNDLRARLPEQHRHRALPALAAVTLALLVVCVARSGGDDEAPTDPVVTAPVGSPDGEPDPPVAAPKPVAPPPDKPEPPVEKPEPPPPAAPEVAGPPVPLALATSLATMLASDDKRDRKRAAETVLAHKPKEEVPTYVLNLAWLEKAGSCAAKRGVIDKMGEAGDARVLPALHRLRATPRRGCGFFSSKDCLACLRESLARAIGRLEPAK